MHRVAAILAVSVLASCTAADPPPRVRIAEVLPAAVRLEFGDTTCSATAVGRDLLLTAAHCRAPKATYVAVTRDGDRLPAEIVRASPLHDLAVLRVSGADFRPIQIAPAGSIEPGDTVYAIGQPLSLGWTVSRGIVSYVGRAIAELNNGLPLIQFDATIHPGSSGGALIDESGRLVGVIIGGLPAPDGHGLQLNFAVPVENIRPLLRGIVQ
jgi:S1-C subfamily serine protease